jgi:hypothetical protein
VIAARAPILSETPPDDWPGTQLRPQLAQLAAGLDERFVRGGNLLADAVGTIATLQSGLEAMNRALDADAATQAVAQLRAAAQDIENVPDMLQRRDGDLVEVGTLVRALDSHIEDLRRQVKVIGIYGMNIKIAGAGGDFRIFVDDMAGRLTSGEGEIDIFAKRLRGVLQSVAPVRKAYADMLAAQSRTSHQVHRQIGECGTQLERHLSDGTTQAGQLAVLARQVHDSVSGVLSAIQIADSTRQRIEHVVGLFDIVAAAAQDGAMPDGARDQVARLAAALIDGAWQDHARQSHELRQSLARLAAASGDLAGLVDRRVAGSGARSLRDLETGIAAIAAMTSALADATVRADAMVGCITDATDDLTGRLDSIDQIVRDVKAIAINTRLLCLRQGQTGVAVAVIAVEVAAQASQLKDTAAQVAAAIARLAALNQGLRGDSARGDPGAVLDQARGVIAEACRHSDAAMADGEVHVRRLMAQLDDAGAVIGDDDDLARTLKLASAVLARPAPRPDAQDEAWLAQIMPQIGALYTMAAERHIHAAFAPAGTAAAPAPAVATVEQDDDGLF